MTTDFGLSHGGRSGGGPYFQLSLQLDQRVRTLFLAVGGAQLSQQQLQRLLPNLVRGLAQDRQRRRQVLRPGEIVESDDADLFRTTDAKLVRSAHDAEQHSI